MAEPAIPGFKVWLRALAFLFLLAVVQTGALIALFPIERSSWIRPFLVPGIATATLSLFRSPLFGLVRYTKSPWSSSLALSMVFISIGSAWSYLVTTPPFSLVQTAETHIYYLAWLDWRFVMILLAAQTSALRFGVFRTVHR